MPVLRRRGRDYAHRTGGGVLGNDTVRDLLCAALYKRTWALTKAQIARMVEAVGDERQEAAA